MSALGADNIEPEARRYNQTKTGFYSESVAFRCRE